MMAHRQQTNYWQPSERGQPVAEPVAIPDQANPSATTPPVAPAASAPAVQTPPPTQPTRIADPGAASSAPAAPAVPSGSAPTQEKTPVATAPVPPTSSPSHPTLRPVHWQADEYISHERNGLWFAVFGLVVALMITLAVVLMRSWTFAALILVMAVALVIYATRPPRRLSYTLDSDGLRVGDRVYRLTDFKSFGVIQDSGHFSILLVPVKRFRPGVTVYFPQEAGEQIVDFLGAQLPMDQFKLDVIDRLLRKLRL